MPIIAPLIAAGSSLLSGILGRKSQADANAQNIKLQKEFAQTGIQWKVEDAKKAGIHPLYALGAQTHSFAPSVVGDTSLPTGLANAGQDISRAIDATRGPAAKVAAYDKTVQELNLTRMGLENELLASQIAKINQAGTARAMPMAVDTVGNPRTDKLTLGVPWSTHPSATDMETFEQRYGDSEVLSTLGGLGVGIMDLLHNLPSSGWYSGK